jgi:nucleotidyltransferase substrate binding protein (TIGR01987 family)
MQFNLASLEKALSSLNVALALPKDDIVRDSVIQRFEYTYELSWKFLKRFLELDLTKSEVDTLNRRELFRIATEKGYISDPKMWFAFHESRNITSHTYNELVAEQVYLLAKSFAPVCAELLARLKLKNT